MPNSSGYVDFNQYAELNQDEEQRLMEEAMARAEAADQTARQQLVRTSQEAVNTGAEGLSRTGSYQDYLKAKKGAADAWAAVGAEGADPRSAALHGTLRARNGVGARATASADELAGREERLGQHVGEAYAGAVKGKADREAYAAAQAKAKEDRAKADQDAASAHYAGVYGRWLAGRQAGGVGVQQQDLQRQAQMLSGGVDAGFQLPGRTAEQMGTPNDRRGWAIEQQAWGTPVMQSGRAKTKKGTWY